MDGVLQGLPEAALLVFALSLDAFAASFAYGTDRIQIPVSSMLVINGISTGILAISLFLGSLLKNVLPVRLTGALCFAILLILGTEKLCDSAIKAYIRSGRQVQKKVSFSKAVFILFGNFFCLIIKSFYKIALYLSRKARTQRNDSTVILL